MIGSGYGVLRHTSARMISWFGDTDDAGARRAFRNGVQGGIAMLMILIIVLIVLAIGAAPNWPYSRGWGYYPSGLLGLILLILIILALTGRL
jgi:hypothetical protein